MTGMSPGTGHPFLRTRRFARSTALFPLQLRHAGISIQQQPAKKIPRVVHNKWFHVLLVVSSNKRRAFSPTFEDSPVIRMSPNRRLYLYVTAVTLPGRLFLLFALQRSESLKIHQLLQACPISKIGRLAAAERRLGPLMFPRRMTKGFVNLVFPPRLLKMTF
jgi:hypothetical protein